MPPIITGETFACYLGCKLPNMKKIIIAFDGRNYPESALEFARQLNEAGRILLTGVFAPNVSFAGSMVYPEVPATVYPLADEETVEAMEENITRFQHFCSHNDIDCRVHKDTTDFALPELRQESRFADLMLVGSESLLSRPKEERISELFKAMLHLSECPVMIMPDHFRWPEQLVLAYDGSEESVYAIKQFAYLFPELCALPAILVYANPKQKKTIPEISNIEELAARHFPDLTIEKLEIMPRDYFATWINIKKSPLLVAGSFARSSASRLFKRSFITDVIEFTGTTIFVAHR